MSRLAKTAGVGAAVATTAWGGLVSECGGRGGETKGEGMAAGGGGGRRRRALSQPASLSLSLSLPSFQYGADWYKAASAADATASALEAAQRVLVVASGE